MVKRADIDRFARGVGEKLGHYVYVISSRGTAIYIGHGQHDRLFSHLNAARERERGMDSEKLDAIRQAWKHDGAVDVYIAASGLAKETAEALEAVLIAHTDRLLKDGGHPGLANLIAGTGGRELMLSLPEVNEALHAEPVGADFHDYKLLLISFNGKLDRSRRDDYAAAVHEDFSRCWKLDLRRAKTADRVVLVAHGLIRSVVIASGWFKCRREKNDGQSFTGAVDPDLSHWIGKRLPEGVGFAPGQPLRYIGF